jgi:hypothetical protein
VRKVREAGALYGGREPGRWTWKPLGSRDFCFREGVGVERMRGAPEVETPSARFSGGRASETERPRRADGLDPN